MRISYIMAGKLEDLVRGVFDCDRTGMAGYISAEHFEKEPFDAALIALAPLWSKASFNLLDPFLAKWENIFRGNAEPEVDIQEYVNELEGYITLLQGK